MANIEAVIFDWAGTTVDFGCFAPVQAFIEAFESVGITPTLEEVRKPMGMLKRDHVECMMSMPRIHNLWKERFQKDWTQSDVDVLYEKSEKGIIEIVHQFAEPNPYVIETVALLRDKGIKIGSTTGYTDEMMEIVTKKAKEQGYAPDVWFTPNAVGNMGRPFPYMIYKNMEYFKVSSIENVIKVGDTAADIKEGKHAGVISVGVVEGSSVMGLSKAEFETLSKEEYRAAYAKTERVFREAGADYIIANLGELPMLFR